MRPVTVSVDVPVSRPEVYDFLDELAAHEQFTDHMLREWRCSGPRTGVGARAAVRVRAGGRDDEVVIEVVEAERPVRIVERNTGAGGRRVATGTYELTELPDGGTRVEFTYAWSRVPREERLLAPLVRGALRRGNGRALHRLAGLLAPEGRQPGRA